jgi:hypothetical protein
VNDSGLADSKSQKAFSTNFKTDAKDSVLLRQFNNLTAVFTPSASTMVAKYTPF